MDSDERTARALIALGEEIAAALGQFEQTAGRWKELPADVLVTVAALNAVGEHLAREAARYLEGIRPRT